MTILNNRRRVAAFQCSLADTHVRYGSKADICGARRHVRFIPKSDRESELPQKAMSALPRKRTCAVQLEMSAMGQKRTFSKFGTHIMITLCHGA